MREIKFRAWDKVYKHFHEDDIIRDYVLGDFIDNPEYIVTQQTGLKDKNGREIFEGDIIRITDHPFEGAIPIEGNYEVGYNEQMELCSGSWLLFRMKHYCEVIGNIYENPELLKGE